jgi:hypothetical protein
VWGGWHDGRVNNVLAVDPFRAAFDEGSMADLRGRLARSRLALHESDGWERDRLPLLTDPQAHGGDPGDAFKPA